MMALVDVSRLNLYQHPKGLVRTTRPICHTNKTEGFLSALMSRSRCRSVGKTAALGRFFSRVWNSNVVISWDGGLSISMRRAK